jgi:hypothetical protein
VKQKIYLLQEQVPQKNKNMYLRSKKILVAVALNCFALVGLAQTNPSKIQYHRKINYPASNLIKKLEWRSTPYKYPGTASDMHWWTWGIDDHIYTLEDDGENFGGRYWYAHILKVVGIPPNHKVETVTDFEGYDFRTNIPKKLLLRYVCGFVAIDSTWYICLYDYDWNIPSKPVPFDSSFNRMKMHKPWENIDPTINPQLGFINRYSKHGGVAAIIKSVDKGKTWTNIPNAETPIFFGANFGAPAFLTFGKANTETPTDLAPYIYAISNDVNWTSGDHIRMGRVHRDSVLNKTAWQFYGGTNKNKTVEWTRKETDAVPIFSDAEHIGHPTITYNKALKRYILINFSDRVPHKENASPAEYSTWDKGSELQMYESKNPWGPWSIFHSEDQWGGKNHTNYLGQMPSKWISADGLKGSILFSGDYTRDGAHYAFMTQSFELILK